MKIRGLIVAGLGAVAWAPNAHAQQRPEPAFSYQTLQFEGASTFFTGIHDTIITGNSVIPGTTATGGLLYDMASKAWLPFPEATANGANYPGAIVSSPYGPGFGSQSGILRVVGSYQTASSAPYDLGYLYDAAAAPGQQLTTLQYPGSGGAQTLFTIAHSTFGNELVGNYDTRLATGNAFIYNIKTGAYTTNNKPGAVSTTAYGIWGDKIAGGYFEAALGGGAGPGHGYIYDKTTGLFTTYDHPGAVETHFEGIVGAGRAGEYNLVTNWVALDGTTHAAVMHLDARGKVTWYEIGIDAPVVSSNSAYGDTVVGIYVDGGVYAYIATIPAMYTPIRNTGTLTSSAANEAALSGRKGDDIVNTGTVEVSGKGGIGMRGETYGVLTNSGTIVATGVVGAAVDLHGVYGTLLNSGTLQASVVADALRTGADSYGTEIVNTGVIDGRIAATAGAEKRFENSGWIGVTGTGMSITHLLSGTFVQTAAGTLSLRVVGASGNDVLGITGVARLAGTLQIPFLTSALQNTYSLIHATQGMTGAFATLSTPGLPGYVGAALNYSGTGVTLDLTSQMALQAGLSSNQRAVGAVVDRAFNAGAATNAGTAATGGLSALYGLTAAQLPQALGALSGEAYASEKSVLIGDGLYSRGAVLDRLRQGAYAGASGPLSALAYGGPALAYSGAEAPAAGSAAAALAYATKAPAASPAGPAGPALWAQGFGGWTSYDGNGNASGVDATIGGVISGADIQAGRWRLGAALGYSQSSADVSGLGSSSTVNAMLAALYGSTSLGPVNLRLGATYAFSEIESRRTIAFPGFVEQANVQYDGGTAQVFAEAGYGFAIQGVALEPFAGLAWVHLNTDGFTETGATAAGLTGSASSADIGYTTLGLRAATAMAVGQGMVLAPHASAAWQYGFGDTAPAARLALIALPGATFTVSGVPPAQNTALVEAGADLFLTPRARIGASYVGQFAGSVTVNAVQASLTWSF